MTINIALATYDGIILGCDSLSSVVEPVLFPFRDGVEHSRDQGGNLLLDAEGDPMISLSGQNLRQAATTVFGGVRKMFCIYEDQSQDTCVAAVTAGMATIGGVTVAEQAKRYRRIAEIEGKSFTTVEEVATDFSSFITGLWEEEFSNIPADDERRLHLPTVQFILAGYGSGDTFGKVYKLDVAKKSIELQFPQGDHLGLCWAGQADYVERLLMGIDTQLLFTAKRQIAEAMARQRQMTVRDISDALTAAQVVLPDELNLTITEHVEPTMPWNSHRADIVFGNLSTQYGVELISMLVNTQSGMQRFARGIPTVGGRTHVGVLKRGEGLALLNEPKLQHKHTGYCDEF